MAATRTVLIQIERLLRLKRATGGAAAPQRPPARLETHPGKRVFSARVGGLRGGTPLGASLGASGPLLAQSLYRLTLAGLMLTILLFAYWQQYILGKLAGGQEIVAYASDYSALATVLLWMLARVAARYTQKEQVPLQFGPPYVTAPLAGLAGLAALSANQAIEPLLSLQIAWHLVVLLGLLLVLLNLRPPAWVVIGPLALLLAAQGILALAQAWAQSTLIGHLLFHWDVEATAPQTGASIVQLGNGTRWLRAYGTFPHPNILGGFLCLALPLVVGAYLRLPRRSLLAWLLLASSLSGLVALILSFSRGAWLGALAGALWVWVIRRRQRRSLAKLAKNDERRTSAQTTTQSRLLPTFWPLAHSSEFIRRIGRARLALLALVSIGALVGLSLALGPILQSRLLLNNAPLEQRSVDERVVLLEASAVFWSQHPLLGVGAGNMSLVEKGYPPTMYILAPTHNVPIAIAVETGTVGLVLWLLPPGWLFWRVWRRSKAEKGRTGEPEGALPDARSLAPAFPGWALPASAALVAVLIAAQFDHYFWSVSPGRLMYWLAVGAAALWLPGL